MLIGDRYRAGTARLDRLTTELNLSGTIVSRTGFVGADDLERPAHRRVDGVRVSARLRRGVRYSAAGGDGGCGTPVVASNLTSLPEVVGDAGLLVDPRNSGGGSRRPWIGFSGTNRSGLSCGQRGSRGAESSPGRSARRKPWTSTGSWSDAESACGFFTLPGAMSPLRGRARKRG